MALPSRGEAVKRACGFLSGGDGGHPVTNSTLESIKNSANNVNGPAWHLNGLSLKRHKTPSSDLRSISGFLNPTGDTSQAHWTTPSNVFQYAYPSGVTLAQNTPASIYLPSLS